MSLVVVQINNIQIYRLSSFPEQRVNDLISELNVHYGKINGYIEARIDKERVSIELIDSLVKLEEINRLAPYRINPNSTTGDFQLGVDLLESIIALLNTQSGHQSTRDKLLSLGWNLLGKLYSLSFEQLNRKAFLFSWLKSKNLVRVNETSRWNSQWYDENKEKIKFSPSEEEINNFYESNRDYIYKYMIYDMASDRSPSDPFRQNDASDFYHYYQTLTNVNVHSEPAD